MTGAGPLTAAPAIGHVVLDRDGVLNREAPEGWVDRIEAWRWEDGAIDGLAALGLAGVRVSVATNQSGIGRGVVERRDVDALHAWLAACLAEMGVDLVGIFVCPHAPDEGCGCRKPAGGLIREAIAASGIDVASTLVVGDDGRDLEAGRSTGARVALVMTGKGRSAAAAAADVASYDGLVELAAHLAAPTATDIASDRSARSR